MFKNLFKKTEEKAVQVLDETSEKVAKTLDETQKDAKTTLHKTNALIDESSDKIKLIAVLFMVGFGFSTVASIANIIVSAKNIKNSSQPRIVNTIYIQKDKETK